LFEQKRTPTIDFFNDEEVSQLLKNQILLSSEKAGWGNDIHLTYYYAYPHEELPECYTQQHGILIYSDKRATSSQSERKMNGRYQNEKLGIGHIVLMPANISKWCYTDKEHNYVLLSLMPARLATVTQELIEADRIELVPHFAHPDPLIHQISLALKSELESNGLGGLLFVESLITTLCLHLLREYSIHKPTVQEYADGLPLHMLQQAVEYIHTHFDQNIKLSELANMLGISQYYFCRLFKQSMGLAPHQYLIQYRIECAKQALKWQKSSITSVALQCGFANPSHFARHFKRLVGISPKAFLKDIGAAQRA
jgi:AraC family transcriptional regulator